MSALDVRPDDSVRDVMDGFRRQCSRRLGFVTLAVAAVIGLFGLGLLIQGFGVAGKVGEISSSLRVPDSLGGWVSGHVQAVGAVFGFIGGGIAAGWRALTCW